MRSKEKEKEKEKEKSKKGGKYIKEGSYGCAFHPHVECKENPSKDTPKRATVGKIFSNDSELRVEERIAKLIQKIDPKNEFTVPFYGKCLTDLDAAKPSDKVDKCSLTENRRGDVQQLVYRYGGHDMDVVMKNIHDKYKALTFDQLIECFCSLFRGLVVLNAQGLSHLDIKPNNLLLTPRKKSSYNLKFIDFGLMTRQKRIERDSYISAKYFSYPPEFKVLYMMQRGIIDESLILKAVLDNFKSHPTLLEFLKFSKYQERLTDFIKRAVGMGSADFEKDFNTIFVHRVDVYQLGIAICDIMENLRNLQAMRIRNMELFNDFVETLMIHMINPNPYDRISPVRAWLLYEKLQRLHRLEPRCSVQTQQEQYKYIKAKEIKELLASKNLPTSGSKEILIARLMQAYV